MSAGICCIHFYIYRNSHPEVFFKKVMLQIIYTVYRRTSIQTCDFNFIEIALLHGYSLGELLLYIVLNIEAINVETL